MATTSPDQEWKKGSAELLVLSLLEDQPRHGYDISKLIQIRSGGVLRFHVTSLYPLLYRLEDRGWIDEPLGGKGRAAKKALLQPDPGRPKSASLSTEELEGIRRGHESELQESNMPDWKRIVQDRIAPLRLEATAESDLVEEFAQHLEDRYRELRSGGASDEEAYRNAISELDDTYPLRAESGRTQRMPKYDPVPAGEARPGSFAVGNFMDVLWRDLRYAVRTMRKAPCSFCLWF